MIDAGKSIFLSRGGNPELFNQQTGLRLRTGRSRVSNHNQIVPSENEQARLYSLMSESSSGGHIRGGAQGRASSLSLLRRSRIAGEPPSAVKVLQSESPFGEGYAQNGYTPTQQLPRIHRPAHSSATNSRVNGVAVNTNNIYSNGSSSSVNGNSHYNSTLYNVQLPKLESAIRQGPTAVGVDLEPVGLAVVSRPRPPVQPNGSASYQRAAHTGGQRLGRRIQPPIDASSSQSSPLSITDSHSASVVKNHPIAPNTSQESRGRAAASSLKGLKPGRPDWINQDNYFLHSASYGDVYCVLDGHGEHGHLVSSRCRAAFPPLLNQLPHDLPRTFAVMQQQLTDARDFDAKCSGATCVLAIVGGSTIRMAHCGDSRAVVGRRNALGGITAVVLTEDHKPDRPDEHRRILNCGGHVGSRQLMMGYTGSAAAGPCRVWYRSGGDTLGLAMSRSLGDVAVHSCGVSAEPELNEFPLDPRDEFLLLATDGLFDVIDSTQAVRLVASLISRPAAPDQDGSTPQPWSPQDVSAQLVALARRRWEAMSAMVDDITVLLVDLRAGGGAGNVGHKG